MVKKLLNDCFAHDSKRLTHHQALALLESRINPVAGEETLALNQAAGRILAAPAVALSPVPAHDNSAVDGYAFAAADYDASLGTEFQVVGRAAAGHPLKDAAQPQTAVRIFTGAVVPDGTDSVVMQEDIEGFERGGANWLKIPAGLKAGANVRLAGEDIAAGTQLLGRGAIIRPQDLAGLASIGLADVSCFKRVKVAIFSTGDEVIRPGAALAPGEVYDANAPMLKALIESSGALPQDQGVLPDKPDALQDALLKTASGYDVIITSGGASVGEEDHLVATLDRIGKRHLWQLAIKPGRPMSFGQINDAVVIGLPGNPVAVFVCFLLYVWPMLRRLGGTDWPAPRVLRLPADFSVRERKTGRREFWRGMLKRSANGGLVVEKFARDGSGLISSLRASDGLIEVAEDVAAIAPGDPVSFIPYSDYGILGR